MHDPVSLLPVGGSSFVEHKRLPHSDEIVLVVDGLVPPGRLPEPHKRRPISPRARRVLLVLVAEEVPLGLLLIPYPTPLCTFKLKTKNKY